MNKDKFTEIIEHIRKVYITYNRPFIVGFSGGKDSSLTLQLVWEAIEGLDKSEMKQPVYVITTDTLVETPYIQAFIHDNIDKINKQAEKLSLPISARILLPNLKDSFWVNLIGKGYPAPSRMFRWCTERLKIEPVDRFIREHVDEWGEATVVIGARRDESASRSQVLGKKVRDALGLSKHPTLPAAYVYAPIEKLSTDDVWQYLMGEDSRWGVDNQVLYKMYQSASGGECPMVLDTSTPSCGNSRFGCWSCTVVQKDHSMESLIEAGAKWMKPLLDFRDFLSSTQEPSIKHKYRSHKRRDGRIALVRDKSKLSYGPYKFEWRKEFLRRLLEAQNEIRQNGPDKSTCLITREELDEIRNIWREEDYDWHDSVPKIYKEGTGEDLYFEKDDGVNLTVEDLDLLQNICENKNVPVGLIARLIDQERKLHGMSRRAGIINKIDKIFSEDWVSEEEAIMQIEGDHAS